MRAIGLLVVLALGGSVCRAQDDALWEARKELTAAKENVEKVVTFCRHCKASGRLEEKECGWCDGLGVMLKCEEKMVEHRHELQLKAERLGGKREDYARYDLANWLEKLQRDIAPETLKLLPEYVAYLKTYRKYEETIRQDERFAADAALLKERLEALIERHGRRVTQTCMQWLYDEQPAGKVGAFNLYGKVKDVRIDGRQAGLFELRTLKGQPVLLLTDQARQWPGFVVGEIVGPGTYRTDDGEEIRGVLIRAY